jgi:lysophospholipid acyltransferase (LPLAT)-like uncharacterized protein
MGYKPPPGLVHFAGWNLSRSLRIRSIGVDNLRCALRNSPTGSLIFCLWHQSLFGVLARHHHQKVAALTSMSGDGTIIASYLDRIGMRAVRGSSSRGGLRAARELIDLIKDGWHAAITVDGPRGPFKIVKPGPFEIARRSGAPMVPVAVRASREYSFKRSWDSFRVPIPGARVALVYGEPMMVAEEYPTPDEIDALRGKLAKALHGLEMRASELVGK